MILASDSKAHLYERRCAAVINKKYDYEKEIIDFRRRKAGNLLRCIHLWGVPYVLFQEQKGNNLLIVWKVLGGKERNISERMLRQLPRERSNGA